MDKKYGLVLAAILIVSLVAAGSFAMGFLGNGKGLMQDESVNAALEAKDYNAFVTAIKDAAQNRASQITEEQFNEMAANYETQKPFIEAHQKVHDAIANKDFAAWQSAMNSMIELQKTQLTQENFDKIVQGYDQMGTEMGGKGHRMKGMFPGMMH